MSYEGLLGNLAERDLRSVDPVVRERIRKRLAHLADDPHGAGTKPLGGALVGFRSLRVGDWRVCYFADHDTSVVKIMAIGHRRDIYERLLRRER